MVIGMILVTLVQASQDEIGKFLGQVLSFLSPALLMELGHCIHLFLQLQQVGAALQLWCKGFSLQWFLFLQSMDSGALGCQQMQHTGSHLQLPAPEDRLKSCGEGAQLLCVAACRIFQDQGSNPLSPVSPALTGKFFTTEPPCF